MQAQQRHIEDMLLSEGWRVAERQVGPAWWLDEVWVLESTWSPVGTRAFARAGILNFSIPGDFEQDMPEIAKWFAEHPPGDA